MDNLLATSLNDEKAKLETKFIVFDKLTFNPDQAYPIVIEVRNELKDITDKLKDLHMQIHKRCNSITKLLMLSKHFIQSELVTMLINEFHRLSEDIKSCRTTIVSKFMESVVPESAMVTTEKELTMMTTSEALKSSNLTPKQLEKNLNATIEILRSIENTNKNLKMKNKMLTIDLMEAVAVNLGLFKLVTKQVEEIYTAGKVSDEKFEYEQITSEDTVDEIIGEMKADIDTTFTDIRRDRSFSHESFVIGSESFTSIQMETIITTKDGWENSLERLKAEHMKIAETEKKLLCLKEVLKNLHHKKDIKILK